MFTEQETKKEPMFLNEIVKAETLGFYLFSTQLKQNASADCQDQ